MEIKPSLHDIGIIFEEFSTIAGAWEIDRCSANWNVTGKRRNLLRRYIVIGIIIARNAVYVDDVKSCFINNRLELQIRYQLSPYDVLHYFVRYLTFRFCLRTKTDLHSRCIRSWNLNHTHTHTLISWEETCISDTFRITHSCILFRSRSSSRGGHLHILNLPKSDNICVHAAVASYHDWCEWTISLFSVIF